MLKATQGGPSSAAFTKKIDRQNIIVRKNALFLKLREVTSGKSLEFSFMPVNVLISIDF